MHVPLQQYALKGSQQRTSDLRGPLTPVVFTLEKACSETEPLYTLKITDVRRLVTCIPHEHKKMFTTKHKRRLHETSTVMTDTVTEEGEWKFCFKYSDVVGITGS
jgi:hypothetical protein